MLKSQYLDSPVGVYQSGGHGLTVKGTVAKVRTIMSGLEHITLRPLHASDEPAVREWLRDYLCDHVAGWTVAHGLAWTAAEVDEHVQQQNLVEQDYADILQDRGDPLALVRVAVDGDVALGMVRAERRDDRYLGMPVGVIGWIYVKPAARRRGVAGLLLEAAGDWMRAQGLTAAEVFVTQSNEAAVRSYSQAGFASLDARLVARL